MKITPYLQHSDYNEYSFIVVFKSSILSWQRLVGSSCLFLSLLFQKVISEMEYSFCWGVLLIGLGRCSPQTLSLSACSTLSWLEKLVGGLMFLGPNLNKIDDGALTLLYFTHFACGLKFLENFQCYDWLIKSYMSLPCALNLKTVNDTNSTIFSVSSCFIASVSFGIEGPLYWESLSGVFSHFCCPFTYL